MRFRMTRHGLAAALGVLALAGTAAQAADGKAYVSNQDGDVSVLDLATMEVVGEINVAGSPRGIGVTSDGTLLAAMPNAWQAARRPCSREVDARLGKPITSPTA